MKEYIIEKYLVYVKNIKDNDTIFYTLEKRSSGNVIIKESDGKDSRAITIDKIEDTILKEHIDHIYKKLICVDLKYGVKYLSNFFKDKNMDILEHGNAEELDMKITDNYQIKTTRYYYDAKGRLYEALFNRPWK